MAAHDNSSCSLVDPSGVGQKRNCTDDPLATAMMLSSVMGATYDPASVDAAFPMASKKQKICHTSSSASIVSGEGGTAVMAAGDGQDRPRLGSPTDVRADPSMDATGSHHSSHNPAAKVPRDNSGGGLVKALPPTLRGVTDAARILHASSRSSSSSGGREQLLPKGHHNSKNSVPPLLLSFPTESVYMMACCVKKASSRSVSKVLSGRGDGSRQRGSVSSASLDSLDSDQDVVRGGSLEKVIHQPNTSLEWLLKLNDPDSMAPSLFVCDKEHALNFCHWSKPRTFAIKPPSLSANSGNPSDNALSLRTPISSSSKPPESMSENSFSPLPVFRGNTAQLTPREMASASSPTVGASSPPATQNGHKVHAASFCESREAFLRLASKFWPGPVVFHVKARMLGEQEKGNASSHLSKKQSSPSFGSLPSLPSMGDLKSAGDSASSKIDSVSILPASVLTPASHLKTSQEGQETESYFVAMQCPSHPLAQKILNEAYRGSASKTGSLNQVSHSPSSNSLASMSSMDDEKAGKNGRARSTIAVVGNMVPGMKAPASDSAKLDTNASKQMYISKAGATTAEGVSKVIAARVAPTSQQDHGGRIVVVNGEDNRETFTVPTCQYGKPYPVSLVVDGENRTIHLIHRCHPDTKETTKGPEKSNIVTKHSVYRALVQPASARRRHSFNRSSSLDSIKEQKGDSSTSIDRVITAVLSRWKVQESTYE